MPTLKRILILSLMAIVAANTNTALLAEELEVQKQQHIHQLLEVTNSLAVGQQVFDGLLELQAQRRPAIPQKVWDSVRELVDLQDLKPDLINIYSRYFTLEEINQLNNFYASPIGVKLVQVQPDIVTDSMQSVQAWAQGLNGKMQVVLTEKGY